MRVSLRRLTAFTALLFGMAAAAAFGPQGHAFSGALADHLLNPNAAHQTARLLGTSLQVAATWADCVKRVERQPSGELRYRPEARSRGACSPFETAAGIPRMEDFVMRNGSDCADVTSLAKCHKRFHYADLALHRGYYERGRIGTSDRDVVSALRAAILVLRGADAPAPFRIQGPTEALLMLAHLVGDVHQPLHVGAVYLDRNDQPFDPDTTVPTADSETHGGNSILDGATGNLHALWDAVPARLAPSRIGALAVAAARTVESTPGDLADWPAAWAGETVLVAREAFAGLSFRRESTSPARWTVRFDDRSGYLLRKEEIQAQQLTRAGARLAAVLNALWP